MGNRQQRDVTGDRNAAGRFVAGNRAAKGNPHAKRVQQLRTALMEAITPDAVERIIAAMVEAAENGDVQAAKLLLDRVFGRVTDSDVLERIEALETLLEQDGRRREA